MAKIFSNVLGNNLYTLPEDYYEYETYPSPTELKYKVILKGKAELENDNNSDIVSQPEIGS